MANNSTNVVPFNFGKQQVRTLLISGEPWFVATDIAAALQYRDSFNMCRNLDDDEKGTQIVSTLGGAQEMLAINESGLYAAILRSRKQEAKLFKKWVTGEVLPAIRKTGRYDDQQGRLVTLIGQTIGTDGFHCLGAVLDGKVRQLPAKARQRAKMHIWSQVHKAFSVVSAQDIPAEQFDSARNFIAAYALEGEYLGPEKAKPQLAIHYPIETLTKRRPAMIEYRGDGRAWLDVSMSDICSRPQDLSLCEEILCALRDAGYEIDGAWFEVRSLRNRLHQLNSLLTGLGNAMQQPTRYGISMTVGRTAA